MRKYILWVLNILFLFFLGVNASGQWNPGETYDLNQESYTKKILWETDQAIYSPTDINESRGHHHIVASYNNNTYVVYIDNDWRPRIVKVTSDGSSEESYLESEDYHILENDSHQFFAIGIDERGYIHVFGDMHNFPRYNSDHLPARFDNAKCMYWRSDNPEDVSSFTWHGEDYGDCPWGTSFTYPQIFYDQNGRLYFSTRVRSETEKQYAAVNYNKYNSNTQQWELIGGTNEYNNMCLFYEDNGEGGGTYSKPCRSLCFDLNNRAHFVSSLYNSDREKPFPENNKKFNTELIYVASDDFGETFHRADGSVVESVPMRVDNEDQRPDLILSNTIIRATRSEAVPNYQCTPYVVGDEYSEEGDIKYLCYTYNESTQTWDDVSDLRIQQEGYFVTDRMGVISYFKQSSNRAYRFFNFGEEVEVNLGGPDICIDRRHLMETGNYRGIPQRSNALQPFSLVEIKINRPYEYPVINNEPSQDAYLKTIDIDAGIMYPVFRPDTTQYTVYVPSDVNSLTLAAQPENRWATVSGDGTYSEFPADVVIKVVAEDNTNSKEYKIRLEKVNINIFAPSNDTYVRGGEYSEINYNDSIIRVKSATNNDKFTRVGYMQFSTDNTLSGDFTKAILKIGVQWVKGETGADLFDVQGSWNENTLTWSETTHLAIGESAFCSFPISSSDEGKTMLVDISDYVETKITSNEDINFKIVANVLEDNFILWSKEASLETNRPQLLIIDKTLTGLEDVNTNNFIIYPTPASQYLTLKTNRVNNAVASLYSITGVVVLRNKINSSTTILDVRNLNRGIYLLQVVEDGEIKCTKKVILN